MRPTRLVPVVVGLVTALSLLVVHAGEPVPLVAHEWGTFTTHHDQAGAPVAWRPLLAPRDLPPFVYSNHRFPKSNIEGTVRMETPVIYFYADAPTKVSVDVAFPGGEVTEWYPRGAVRSHGIRWPAVTVLPGATARLRHGMNDSHYYPARNTDGALVRIRKGAVTQPEKFLFYRGVGTFDLPLTAHLDGDSVHVEVAGTEAIGRVLVLERKDGATGYQAADLGTGGSVLARPVPSPDALAGFEAELKGLLTAAGLFEREAQAMLDTWRSSWSADGLRVLYLVPRAVTDIVLPLTITPTPSALVRVLVGRAEILPPL